MRQMKVIKNSETFTSSLGSTEIPAQNIKKINFGYHCLGTGTTAVTLAQLLGAISNIKLTVGGEIETQISQLDLFVLNFIDALARKSGLKPTWLLTTTTDNSVGWVNWSLPVELTTDKKVYLSLDYGATPDNTDNGKIDIVAEFGDLPFQAKPVCMRSFTQNTATAYVNPIDISVAGKKLLGLLVYSTTIPNGTTDDVSAGEIKVLVNKSEKLHTTWKSLPIPETYVELTTLHGILDNYRYIDLMDDNIASDNIQIQYKSLSAATDAVRVVAVYQ
jgi:hypothetical protein